LAVRRLQVNLAHVCLAAPLCVMAGRQPDCGGLMSNVPRLCQNTPRCDTSPTPRWRLNPQAKSCFDRRMRRPELILGPLALGPTLRRLLIAVASLYVCASANIAYGQAQQPTWPRFASLRADKVIARQAPSRDAAVLWTFHRLGWPVEVLRESGTFAEVRDSDGSVGWVSTSHLSGRRTVIVTAAAQPAGTIVLRADGRETARAAAELEPGLQAVVIGCDGRWCRLMIGEIKGFLEQTRLWGVYVGERIE
jgi:SH3-like domain-containing protein